MDPSLFSLTMTSHISLGTLIFLPLFVTTQAERATHMKASLVQADYSVQRRVGQAWMSSPTRMLEQCCATRESYSLTRLNQEMDGFLQGPALQVVYESPLSTVMIDAHCT